MAEIYGPFDSGPGATFGEDGWSKLMRTIAGDGIIFQYATQVTTPYIGPEENALKVAAAGGLDISLNVGLCNVHGHLYENTSSLTRTHDAAPVTAGQSRNDIVVIRMNKTLNTITCAILKGTAATTPVDPALTRSDNVWEVPIARVNIPANAVNVGVITDLRFFAYIPPELQPPAPKQTGTDTGNITAEVKDGTIGDYQFRAFPGRQYRFNAITRVRSDAVNTTCDLRVRDSGSAASPTTASTLRFAHSIQIINIGGPGAQSVNIGKPIRGLAAGTHTIALFAARTAGGGNIILDNPGGDTKDLWVEDITPRAG